MLKTIVGKKLPNQTQLCCTVVSLEL